MSQIYEIEGKKVAIDSICILKLPKNITDLYYNLIINKLKKTELVKNPKSEAIYILSMLYVSAYNESRERLEYALNRHDHANDAFLFEIQEIFLNNFVKATKKTYDDGISSFVSEYIDNYDRFKISPIKTSIPNIYDIASCMEYAYLQNNSCDKSYITVHDIYSCWVKIFYARKFDENIFDKKTPHFGKHLFADYNAGLMQKISREECDISGLTLHQIIIMLVHRWYTYTEWLKVQFRYSQRPYVFMKDILHSDYIERINCFLRDMLCDPVNAQYPSEDNKIFWNENPIGSKSTVENIIERLVKTPYSYRSEKFGKAINLKIANPYQEDKKFTHFDKTNIEKSEKAIISFWTKRMRFLDLMIYESITGRAIANKKYYIVEKNNIDRDIQPDSYTKELKNIFCLEYLGQLIAFYDR